MASSSLSDLKTLRVPVGCEFPLGGACCLFSFPCPSSLLGDLLCSVTQETDLMYCIARAPTALASSLVGSVEILERDQVVGGEKGGGGIYSLHSWPFSSCFLEDLHHSMAPGPGRCPSHPALISADSGNTFTAFALSGQEVKSSFCR